MSTDDTHDTLIAVAPAEVQMRLRAIQSAVEHAVPQAERCVGYRMPAFRSGRIFFYFAAFKRHIGIYPPLTDDAALVAETAPFRGPKGNLSFAHAQPLPLELIGRVARALAQQYG
jgi:uncharacterized protein YdhG (YjbR/CyaY superfamily)